MIKLPIFIDTYNNKIDCRFIVFTNTSKPSYECRLDDYLVYLGEKRPSDKLQEDICNTKKVFEQLKNNDLNIELIDKCTVIFDFCFNEDKRSLFNTYLTGLKFEDPLDFASKLFVFIIKKKIFNQYSRKFAILIFNSIMVKNNILPIIFYLYSTSRLCELIESGLTLNSLKELLNSMFRPSIKYNTPHKYITDDAVFNLVKDLRESLQNEFGVIHATITGSFANKHFSKFSDLDILLEMKDYSLLNDAEKFISKKVGIPVDAIAIIDPFTSFSDIVKYRIEVF